MRVIGLFELWLLLVVRKLGLSWEVGPVVVLDEHEVVVFVRKLSVLWLIWSKLGESCSVLSGRRRDCARSEQILYFILSGFHQGRF